MVPTGYSLSGTLFLKIRTASFSFSGSAFLMYVFLILCPSRIQVKDFSETVTSCAYTLHTIERNKVNAVPVKRVVIVFIATPFNGTPWRYEKAAGTFFYVLDCETSGHRIQAVLRNHRNRGIDAGDGIIGKRSGDRHDVPGLLFEHLFHGELSDIEESQQVDRGQGVEVVGSEVRERLGVENSGVIHQNIDRSEVLDRCFDSFDSGLLLTNIAIDQDQVG